MIERVYQHYLQLKQKLQWVEVTEEVMAEVAEGTTRLMTNYTPTTNVTFALSKTL